MSKPSPYEILTKLFSPEGYVQGAFSIRLNNNTSLRLHQNEEGFVLEFPDVKPEAVVKKVIQLKVKVNGIVFKENSGILLLDKFQDIPFLYDWVMSANIVGQDFGSIYEVKEIMVGEIERNYSSKKDQKIAHNVLNLCEEWAIIKGAVSVSSMTEGEAKRSCKEYVKENLKPVGAGIFMSIFMAVIVKIIAEWIINNFIYKLKNTSV